MARISSRMAVLIRGHSESACQAALRLRRPFILGAQDYEGQPVVVVWKCCQAQAGTISRSPSERLFIARSSQETMHDYPHPPECSPYVGIQRHG